MTIAESLKEYISNFNCLSTLTNIVNINFLDGEADNCMIEQLPVDPVIKKYTNGTKIKQFQFNFVYRFSYSAEVLQNITNSSLLEDFVEELEDKTSNNILPILKSNLEPIGLNILTTPYISRVEEDTCVFVVNLKLKYKE